MQIGQVIRKYRKEKNLTQEEMANRLGVTAPAVNKWENGASLPDVALLAPIARLLGITTDTLLSFREELTAEEISAIVQEADAKLRKEAYEDVFRWAKEKVNQYPNCEALIWQLALIMDAWRLGCAVPDTEKYDECVSGWYARGLESSDEELRIRSADSLFAFYMRKESCEKAEEYLPYFSKQNPERKRKQAEIYRRTGRKDEAYRAYEELLFEEYGKLDLLFGSIYLMAMQDGDRRKAQLLVDKQKRLAEVFDRGQYAQASCELDLAVAEEDKERTIAIVEKMLADTGEQFAYADSPLYEHMTFREVDAAFWSGFRKKLMDKFRNDDIFRFLEQDERWQELIT